MSVPCATMTSTKEAPVTTPQTDPRQWALGMLEPGVAVILDCETTGFDGSIIEIAVIDAATGVVQLDTLVDPGDVAIEPGAQAVHGITAADLVGAPTWPQVLPLVVEAVAERIVLAYNAPFDRGRILHDCARTGTAAPALADETRWQCVMEQRSAALGTDVKVPLSGGHRAHGDTVATRAVLVLLGTGRPDIAGAVALDAHQRRKADKAAAEAATGTPHDTDTLADR